MISCMDPPTPLTPTCPREISVMQTEFFKSLSKLLSPETTTQLRFRNTILELSVLPHPRRLRSVVVVPQQRNQKLQEENDDIQDRMAEKQKVGALLLLLHPPASAARVVPSPCRRFFHVSCGLLALIHPSLSTGGELSWCAMVASLLLFGWRWPRQRREPTCADAEITFALGRGGGHMRLTRRPAKHEHYQGANSTSLVQFRPHSP